VENGELQNKGKEAYEYLEIDVDFREHTTIEDGLHNN
jgi:hypothetical protein